MTDSDIEAVNYFNNELSSLYEVKPPISKGKMTAITKAALKASRLYKHVVQSVEKFIQKCKPEYKIPGLYVIDSIIRQSRHQNGPEKDAFAPRFARNIQTTFVYLYKCPPEDKSKIIRVLNLWQKNRIFEPEVIAPLFDLVDPNNPIWDKINSSSNNEQDNSNSRNSTLINHEFQFKSSLLDYDYDEDEPGIGGSKPVNNSSSNSKPQAPPPPIIRPDPEPPPVPVMGPGMTDAIGSILNNPEILRQLQTLQEQLQTQQFGLLSPEQERQRKLAELNKQEAAFDQRLAQTVAKIPFAVECGDFIESQEQNMVQSPNSDGLRGSDLNSLQIDAANLQQAILNSQFAQLAADQRNPFGIPLNFPVIPQQLAPQNEISMFNPSQNDHMGRDPYLNFENTNPFQQPIDQQINGRDRRDRDRGDRGNERRRRRSRSNDRDRSSRRSNSPRSGRRRSRSNSRNRNSNSRSSKRYRSRSRERREEREREKERQRKGFGVAKRDHLSICSTTLWVGHLSKLVTQEEISDTFGPYGDIISIDVIQSRGCAFIVMDRRQDACRALDRLKNTKLQGKTITLAWAPGKGVKGREWKDYWEVDAGISYIPWSKLNEDVNLSEFEDGGCIDESTLPEFLKNKPKVKPEESKKEEINEDTLDSALPNPKAEPKSKSGDTDSRNETPAIPTGVPQPVPPPSASAFGMPPPVGMMGVPPMGLNMMPPPMLGPPLGLPPQFGGMMNMPPMMGLMGPPSGPGMPPGMGPPPMGLNPSSDLNNSGPNPMNMKPPGMSHQGPGFIGNIPLPMTSDNSVQSNNIGTEDSHNEGSNDDRREGREKKRSRFDSFSNDRHSQGPARPWMEGHEPPNNDDSDNPFLNPSQNNNPFVSGNPFVSNDMPGENPFDISPSFPPGHPGNRGEHGPPGPEFFGPGPPGPNPGGWGRGRGGSFRGRGGFRGRGRGGRDDWSERGRGGPGPGPPFNSWRDEGGRDDFRGGLRA